VTEHLCSRRCNGKRRAVRLIQFSANMKGRKRKDRRFGAENPAWKGGVTYFKTHGNYRGVKYVRAQEWAKPMARKDGYLMEHRIIVAMRAGRLLMRAEVVNHIDRSPMNNDPKNLELWPSNADHKRGEAGRFVIGVANRWRGEGLVLL
jgi:hypothetical protein